MSSNFFFFGDSICTGQHVAIHKTWVHQVSSKLHEIFGKTFIPLNASVNGNTTRLSLERFYYDVLAHKPRFLYIQLGMNDCNVWATDLGLPRVSLNAYIENLREIIDKALAAGVERVFLNTNHESSLSHTLLKHTNASYEEYNTLYYNALQKFQKLLENHKNIIPLNIRKYIQNKEIEPTEYLLKDGIHLNETGHRLYYQYIYPLIKEHLEFFF